MSRFWRREQLKFFWLIECYEGKGRIWKYSGRSQWAVENEEKGRGGWGLRVQNTLIYSEPHSRQTLKVRSLLKVRVYCNLNFELCDTLSQQTLFQSHCTRIASLNALKKFTQCARTQKLKILDRSFNLSPSTKVFWKSFEQTCKLISSEWQQ